MTIQPPPHPEPRRRKHWLRKTLRYSQKEATASAVMTATGDNYYNAFAVYLQATAVQMGWLTAIPQFAGAVMQLFSVWLGTYVPRRHLIAGTAAAQAIVVGLIASLAYFHPPDAVLGLTILAVAYHGALNLIQPQWRAWMGSIVPPRRRGTFFASRTSITMVIALGMFVAGGGLLSFFESQQTTWLGFALLFAIAAVCRMISSYFIWQMHDPDVPGSAEGSGAFVRTLANFRTAAQDEVFRNYTLFVAGMQAVVAISAPFFAVYMLKDLEFSYFQYGVCSATSIAVQFVALPVWGRFSDRYGNRLVMLITSFLLPLLPLLWIFSPNFFYLLLVQMLSGFAWSGFSLSTANYLYDIRPHRSDFATYAAVQSACGAALVFIGAIAGGYLAASAEQVAALLPSGLAPSNPLFVVFITSGILRAAITVWFVPRAVEPRIRQRPQLLDVIFRVARFNAISGLVLDWLTVSKKDPEE